MGENLKGIFKLIFGCACVTAPFWGAVILCSTHLLYIVGKSYVPPLWNRDFTNSVHEKYYDVVILGDSTANAAYIPEVLSDGTINLALPASSTAEGYYTLVDYLDNNKAPKDVFISYMDYHLQEDVLNWDVGNYIHKFSEEQNEEIKKELDKYATVDIEELTAKDYWNEVRLYQYYMPQKYMHALVYSVIENRPEYNLNRYNNISIRNGRAIAITNEEYNPEGVIGYSNFEVSKFNEIYYYKILDLCEANDIAVHIIKLPLSTDSGFIDDYEEEVADYYDELLEDYDNADFYWFHTTYEHEFFLDQYHPNNHGAFRFSRELKEQYPEVFEKKDECSPERMQALDEDIKGENYLGELTKWVNDMPYTIVFLDNGVNLEEYYYMCVGYDEKWVNKLDLDNVYYLSADDTVLPDSVHIERISDGRVEVVLDDGESATLQPTDNVGISFIVIDNVNDCIVCQRQCNYSELKFSPIL